MKKRSTSLQSPKRLAKAKGNEEPMTVGMDLGDKHSCYCLLRSDGQVQREAQVATSKKALREVFGPMARTRVAIEVGTHSHG